MHDDWIEPAELTPDLEWLLQSSNADENSLLYQLTREYGARLFQVGLAIFQDEAGAFRLVQEAFLEILRRRHRYQQGVNLPNWIFGRAIDAGWRLRRPWEKEVVETPYPVASELLENFLPPALNPVTRRWLDDLPEAERLTLLLHLGFGLALDDVASILHTSLAVTRGRLFKTLSAYAEFTQQVNLLPAGLPWPAAGLSAEIVQAAWPAHAWTSAAAVKVISAALEQAGALPVYHRLEVSWREVGLVGLAIFLVMSLTWFFNLIDPDTTRPLQLYALTPSPMTAEVDGADFNEIQRHTLTPGLLLPINTGTSPEEIMQRLNFSSVSWDPLWLDVIVARRGAYGHNGQPVFTRVQYWQSTGSDEQDILVLMGPLFGSPTRILGYDRGYDIQFADIEARVVKRFHPLDEQGEVISFFDLNASFMWGFASENFPETELVVGILDEVASRPVLEVEQRSANGQRLERLWLDTQTVFPLRHQVFSNANPDEVLWETYVLDIRSSPVYSTNYFSQTLPFPAEYLGEVITELPAALESEWGLGVTSQPLETIDLSRMNLSFEFNLELRANITNEQTSTLVTDILAGDEILQHFDRGFTWQGFSCQRSPDGLGVALLANADYFSDGSVDTTLRWIDLVQPSEVYTLLTEKQIVDFAISPDSRWLAAATQEPHSGIYLVDLRTRQEKRILEVTTAHGLVWNPDSSQLALLGFLPTGEAGLRMLVLDANSGEILYNLPTEVGGAPPADNPTVEWGVAFPKTVVYGPEGCWRSPLVKDEKTLQTGAPIP